MATVKKNDEIRHITGMMGLHQPQTTDIIKRENYPAGAEGDEQYVTACAQRDLEGENPRLAELKRKYYVELERQREDERKEREAQIYAEARANAKLTAREKDEVSRQALEAANADLKAGRITPQQFDNTRAKHMERLENRRLDEKATAAGFNQWFSAEIKRNRMVSGTGKAAPSVGDTGGA